MAAPIVLKKIGNFTRPGRLTRSQLFHMQTIWLFIQRVFKWVFIFPVRLYQKTLSPMLGANCRFQPSCSQYMIEAIEEWGVMKGIYLGTRRILRCHPWGDFGPDPVPKNPKRH